MPNRVLFLHSSAGLYGADLQLAALASGLHARGWDPLVLVASDGPLVERLQQDDIEVRIHPLAVLRRRLLSPGGVLRLGIEGWRERAFLAGLARDAAVVHSNTSVVIGGFAAARAAGVPHVVHVREIYAGAASGLAARGWPLWRSRLAQADALVCVSGAVAAQFDARTHVVHDGLTRKQSRFVRPIDGQTEIAPLRIAVLGRIADWKGQDVLIRALAEAPLAEIGAIAVIAGDAYPGETAPDIEALGRALGVHDRVRFLGFRPDADEILASVDAVAVPSTRPDPLPNSAIEALAAGKPVVASSTGGLPEIVTHDETGILIPPGDPKALARALRELADDPERRARMGEAAAADARERFSPERMLDQIEAVYGELGVRRSR